MALAPTASDTLSDTSGEGEPDRHGEILQAALNCFAQLGIARTSVQDVADAAGVSRGTIYRYFDDRQVLIDAAIALGARQYYAEAARAMDRKDTLADQMGAMGEVVAKTVLEHGTRRRLLDDDAGLMRMIVSGSEGAVRRTTEFLASYVEAARSRGETRADLDVTAAAEWLARLMHSLTTVQDSSVFDISSPRSVGRFVSSFAVAGLS